MIRRLIAVILVGSTVPVLSACWGHPPKKHQRRQIEVSPPTSPTRTEAVPKSARVQEPAKPSRAGALAKPAQTRLGPKAGRPGGQVAGSRVEVRAMDAHVRSPSRLAGQAASPKKPSHPGAQRKSAQPKSVALPSRPNILVLLLDDQDDITPYWEGLPQTAAMMQSGLRFRNAFSPTPICTPGRCTFLSGRLAHNTGVFTLVGPDGGAVFGRELGTTFALPLQALGYANAHFGKTWGQTQLNPGWRRWCAVGGNNMYTGYGYDVTDTRQGGGAAEYQSGEYLTDFLSDQVVEFLQRELPNAQPFFICLAPTAPHLPLPPAPRHAAYAKRRWGDRLPHRPNHNEHNVSDKSRWLREQAAVRSACVPYATEEYHKRMGSLLAVDDMMARVRGVLTAQGRWENTIVVVTSDNGYNLGAHRLIHKMAPYEESIHVPLYVAGPSIAGGEVDKLVGLHDLAPTFIQLAGGQPPSFMDGKSLVPFLITGSDNAVPTWRTSLVTEYDSGGVTAGFNPGGAMRVGWELDIPTYRSIRTEAQKYILWLDTGEEEVYDLVNDPFELNNLTRADRPAAAALLPQLRGLLASQRNCAGGGCP
jgi:arylsulfatase A-like enzyme